MKLNIQYSYFSQSKSEPALCDVLPIKDGRIKGDPVNAHLCRLQLYKVHTYLNLGII